MKFYIDRHHLFLGWLFFHICFHRECIGKVFVMKGEGMWLLHVGPIEVSNRRIY